MAAITITDVARRSGFSICTVSKVLSGGERAERFSSSCRRKVQAAAAAIGYRGNHLARALRSRRCGTIGVLFGVPVVDVDTLYFRNALVCATDAAVRSAGFHTVLLGRHGVDDIAEAEAAFAERRIDGLVVCQPTLDAADRARLERIEHPIALLLHRGATPLPRVELDARRGIDAAVDHLAALGHRRLAWMGPVPAHHEVSAAERRAGVRAGAARHGMTFESIDISARGDTTSAPVVVEIEAARAALSCRLAEPGHPGAILCYNDVTALGAYAALRQAGLRVGADVSVIGFDDVLAATAYPALTSISHATAALGRAALELLVEMIERPARRSTLRGRVVHTPSSLVLRSSTGPAAHSS